MSDNPQEPTSTDELIKWVYQHTFNPLLKETLDTLFARLRSQQDENERLKREERYSRFTIEQVQKRERQAFEAFQDRESQVTDLTAKLKFLRERLINVYGESPNTDYLKGDSE